MIERRLVLPHFDYRDSYLEALQEFHAEGLNLEWDQAELTQDFGRLLQFLENVSHGIALPDGDTVPWTQYWFVELETKMYIGRLNIRHYLSEDLKLHGGHIGYQIRPSMRGKGYGREQLQQGLILAREQFGIQRALFTCDPDNHISRHMIEQTGGTPADDLSLNDDSEVRYWIDLF